MRDLNEMVGAGRQEGESVTDYYARRVAESRAQKQAEEERARAEYLCSVCGLWRFPADPGLGHAEAHAYRMAMACPQDGCQCADRAQKQAHSARLEQDDGYRAQLEEKARRAAEKARIAAFKEKYPVYTKTVRTDAEQNDLIARFTRVGYVFVKSAKTGKDETTLTFRLDEKR